MQRSERAAGGALAIARIGVLERVRIHRDGRVQLVFVRRDAGQVLTHQFVRRDAALFHRRAHLGNRRLNDGKRLVLGRRRDPARLH